MKRFSLVFLLLFLIGCNSNLSSTETVVLNTEEYLSLEMYHNKNVNHDPFVEIDEAVEIYKYYLNNLEQDLSDIEYEDGFIFFGYSEINELNPGMIDVEVYTDKGIISIDLELVDDNIPYIVGNNNVHYLGGSDVRVLIETFGEGLEGISTTGEFDEGDYSFSGRELVIKKAFIEEKLVENPDRTNIIFMISVNYNETDVLVLAINVIID